MTNDSAKAKFEPSEAARTNYYHFKEAYDAHERFVREAIRNNKFYIGEQWDPADKKRLESEGRPCLTLNFILSTVNTMIGEQLDRKIDVTYTAADGGSEATAYALNKLTRAILNENRFDDLEEKVFADGIIMGRGFYDIRLGFETNVRGDAKIAVEDPIDIIIDAQAKEEDPETWNEVFTSRWMTLDQISAEFGAEKATHLRRLAAAPRDALGVENFEYYDQSYGRNVSGAYADGSEEESRKLRRVRVIERQHYVPCECFYLIDTRTGDMRPAPMDATKEQVDALIEQYQNLGYIKRRARRVRITTSVDDVLLHDDWSLYRSFTIVPFFPYFRRGNPFGVVSNLIDPQNLLNKTSSQELHIVNTTANSGWVVQEDSLVDMDQEDLEERGAQTGLVLTYKRGYEKPEKITPNQIPTGIERISQKAAMTIREISAVNAAMMGASRADQSGRAQEASISRGQIQVSVVLNNLLRSRYAVTRKILELVQDYYTEERYFNVVADELFSSVAEQTQQMGINVEDEAGNIINQVSLGKYHIHVGHAPSGGTAHDMQMEELRMLRGELGVAVPDHVMVKYSRFVERNQLSEFLKNAQGFGEPSEEEQQLQSFRIEHEIRMLTKELEDMDASIQQKESAALKAAAEARSLDGYNQMQLEITKLRDARKARQDDLALRVALAARSHQNAQSLQDKRNSATIATKAMDMLSPPEPKADKPKPKGKK